MKSQLDDHTKIVHFLVGSPEDAYEATVDGTHPTDVGFLMMAKSLYPEILKIVEKSHSK